MRGFVDAALWARQQTTAELLRGVDINDTLWSLIAAELAPLEDASPEIRDIAYLAAVAQARDMAEVERLRSALPGVADPEVKHLAEALLDRARTQHDDSDQAGAWFAFGTALYDLTPYAPDVPERFATAVAALRRCAHLYAAEGVASRRAIAGIGQYAGAANELAKVTEAIDLDDVLSVGETILRLMHSVQADDAVVAASVASNLVNTCKALAARHQDRRVDYYERGLRLIEFSEAALRSSDEPRTRHSMRVAIEDSAIGNAAYVRAMMALCGPEQFDAHADAAIAAAIRKERLAEELDDPDGALSARRLHQQIVAAFRNARSEWTGKSRQGAAAPQPDYELLDAAVKAHTERAKGVAEQAQSAAGPTEQAAVLEAYLDATYPPLTAAIQAVIAEVGLNFHVLRLIATLGALASGRLGAAADMQVRRFTLADDEGDVTTPFRRAVSDRQRLRPDANWTSECEAIGIAWGVAVLCSTVAAEDALHGRCVAMLQDRNASLLREVLMSRRLVDVYADVQSRAESDVAHIAAALPSSARSSLEVSYKVDRGSRPS